MRFLLELRGRFLDVTFGRAELDSGPEPQDSTCGVLERTPAWDHDNRPPVGFEGSMSTSIGDWVIKGVQGEFYPCKPDIFAATYEAVES